MKLGYVPKDLNAYTPLVRLYDFTPPEVRHLHALFTSLATGTPAVVSLHDQPWVQPVDGCRLYLLFDSADRGVMPLGLPTDFACTYSEEGWLELAGKAEPFLDGWEPYTDQWLTNEGDVQFLLSPDGRW